MPAALVEDGDDCLSTFCEACGVSTHWLSDPVWLLLERHPSLAKHVLDNLRTLARHHTGVARLERMAGANDKRGKSSRKPVQKLKLSGDYLQRLQELGQAVEALLKEMSKKGNAPDRGANLKPSVASAQEIVISAVGGVAKAFPVYVEALQKRADLRARAARGPSKSRSGELDFRSPASSPKASPSAAPAASKPKPPQEQVEEDIDSESVLLDFMTLLRELNLREATLGASFESYEKGTESDDDDDDDECVTEQVERDDERKQPEQVKTEDDCEQPERVEREQEDAGCDNEKESFGERSTQAVPDDQCPKDGMHRSHESNFQSSANEGEEDVDAELKGTCLTMDLATKEAIMNQSRTEMDTEPLRIEQNAEEEDSGRLDSEDSSGVLRSPSNGEKVSTPSGQSKQWPTVATPYVEDVKNRTAVSLKTSSSKAEVYHGGYVKGLDNGLQYRDPEQFKVTLAELQVLRSPEGEAKIEGVDPARREAYLTDGEFAAGFGMLREEFYQLPKWRQQNLKKTLHLF